MKKNYIFFITGILVLVTLVAILFWFNLSNKENPIVGTYKSEKYGYSFQVPDNFFITRAKCESGSGIECLEEFTITPKSYSKEDLKYLDVGGITVLKGLKNIRFSYGNGGPSSYYDTKTGKWLVAYPTEDSSIVKDMAILNIGNNTIHSTGEGGSHGGYSVYLITNKDRDIVFVIEVPLAKRIRCDFIKDVKETKACENYLQGIRAMEEGWTRDSFFSELFKDKDKILESFRWESSNKQVSPTLSPTMNTSDWKTYTNTTFNFQIKYPSSWSSSNYEFSRFDQGNLFLAAESGEGKQEGERSGLMIANPIKTSKDAYMFTKENYIPSEKINLDDSNTISTEKIGNNEFVKLVSCSMGCYSFFSIKKGDYLYSFVFYGDDNIVDKILSTFDYWGPEMQVLLAPKKCLSSNCTIGDSEGVAMLTETGNGKTKIIIGLENMAGKLPVAIYRGSCNKIGPIKFTLSNINNGFKTNSGTGKSETILDMSLDSLRSQEPLAIGVRSTISSGPLDWCGEINF